MTDDDLNLNPKPTPGPWHVGAGLMVCAVDGSPIARCSATRGKYEFEQVNAYLLAAAPELLAALTEMLMHAEAPSGVQTHGSVRSARVAIAKAKGGAA